MLLVPSAKVEGVGRLRGEKKKSLYFYHDALRYKYNQKGLI